MPAKRGTYVALAIQDDSLGDLSALDEDAAVEVLRAALPAKVLASLASSSRQLCSLARSGVPVCLRVSSSEQAQLVLRSHASGRPPFRGCKQLQLSVGNLGDCVLAGGVLSTAQHWTALQWLDLTVELKEEHLALDQSLDLCVSALLSTLPALQQLRGLQLTVPDLGPCSAGCIGHLVQLTRLRLGLTTAPAAAAAADEVRLDLGSWLRLTNLKSLELLYAPAVQPAAGAMGPFCLPSSLTSVILRYTEYPQPDALACWVTHLAGCPQLQQLEVVYGPQQHASTHPRALVRLLAQHTPRLRVLDCWHEVDEPPVWGAAVAGLPDGAGPVEEEWHPGPALAALRELEGLTGDHTLTLREEAHWQHLVQLTALTQLYWTAIHYAPPLQVGATLGVLELGDCMVHLGGHGLGRLLLACPQLQKAEVIIGSLLVSTAVGPPVGQLQPHPRLKALLLNRCHSWSSAAAAAAAVAAPAPAPAGAVAVAAPPPAALGATAHFSALAPVLGGVAELALYGWPACSSSSPVMGTLPDLSPCTGLTQLAFHCHHNIGQVHPEQEQYLSMVVPLGAKLQHLEVWDAPRLNARVALGLQSMLPQLQSVELRRCGGQLPLLLGGSQQQEQQVLESVRQLLRPGLVLVSTPPYVY